MIWLHYAKQARSSLPLRWMSGGDFCMPGMSWSRGGSPCDKCDKCDKRSLLLTFFIFKTTKQMCTGATYTRVYRKFLSRCHVVTAEAAAAVTGVTGVPENSFPFPVWHPLFAGVRPAGSVRLRDCCFSRLTAHFPDSPYDKGDRFFIYIMIRFR